MTRIKMNSETQHIQKQMGTSILGIEVNIISMLCIKPRALYPPKIYHGTYNFNSNLGRTLNEYQIIYITRGGGTLQIEETKYLIRKGNVFILFPNQWHTYKPDREVGWDEYHIGFRGEYAKKWMENLYHSSESQVFNIGLNEKLVQLFKRAHDLYKFSSQPFNIHLSGITYHILGLLSYQTSQKDLISSYKIQLIEKSKILMNENVSANMNIEDLSEKLNVNYTTFRKIFKDITGNSPKQYFIELKIHKAKQILLDTSMSIKGIASILGFSSTEHFTNTFKCKIGYTPKKYRELCRPKPQTSNTNSL